MKPKAQIIKHSFILLIFICAIFLPNISALSAGRVRTNYEILDSLSKLAAAALCNALSEFGESKYIIKLPANSASQLIEQNTVVNCKPDSILFLSSSDSTDIPVVEILINKFGVKYSNHPEIEYLLEREAFCEISFMIKKNNQEIRSGRTIKFMFGDTIDRGSIRLIENSGYDFAKATVPEPPDSFIKQIAEPLIIIGSAAIAVFLFFTVRSG